MSRDIFDFSPATETTSDAHFRGLGISVLSADSNNSHNSNNLFAYADTQEQNVLSKWSQQKSSDYTPLNSSASYMAGSSASIFDSLQKSIDNTIGMLNASLYPAAPTTPSNGSTTPAALVSTSDWYSLNLKDSQICNLARNLGADGSLSRNDFLNIFERVEQKATVDSNELADLKTLTSVSNTPFKISEDVKYLGTKVAQSTTLNMNATTFDSLVGKWFLGTVPPTASFSHELTHTSYELAYTPIQGSLFGATGHAQIADINQGYYMGDCAFLSALGATFAPQSNDATHSISKTIDNMIIDNHDNTYSVKFHNDTNNNAAEYVTVDRRVATFQGGIFGAHSKTGWNPNDSNNVIWSALVERAYAQWFEGYGLAGYNKIGNGDLPKNPLDFVTGIKPKTYSGDSLTFSLLQSSLAGGHAIETFRSSGSTNDYIVGSHAYAVTNAYVDSIGQQHIVVRNPWGVDGAKYGTASLQDGFVDLYFNAFKSYLDGGVTIA